MATMGAGILLAWGAFVLPPIAGSALLLAGGLAPDKRSKATTCAPGERAAKQPSSRLESWRLRVNSALACGRDSLQAIVCDSHLGVVGRADDRLEEGQQLGRSR